MLGFLFNIIACGISKNNDPGPYKDRRPYEQPRLRTLLRGTKTQDSTGRVQDTGAYKDLGQRNLLEGWLQNLKT